MRAPRTTATAAAALVAGLALAGTAGTAGTAIADTAKRKGAPDKFAQAAGEAFQQALAADQAGDLRTALGLYQKAFAISPHPSTAYNIADVQRRLLQYTAAQKSYETYLALMPHAPDRRDVEALLEKLVKTPGTLHLVTGEASDPNAVDWKSAYVLVDGDLKIKPGTAPQPQQDYSGRLGYALSLPPGTYVVDVVTPLTHGHQACRVDIGGRSVCQLSAKPRVDGRLVVNASDRVLSVRVDPKERASLTGQRVELPAGMQRLLVRDRTYECSPAWADLPPGGDVQYVFVSTSEHEYERCRTLDVKQQRLVFRP